MSVSTQVFSDSNVYHLQQVSRLIGNTPLFPISNVYQKKGVQIYAKLEWQQLGGSVKSRPAFGIISDAIHNGLLKKGKRLLDATSGNTGIAYAAIARSLGLEVTLCLPENASPERKRILKDLGADLIFTSRFESTDGARQVARDIAAQYPERYFYADQYSNIHNWKAHYNTTALEIWHQTGQQITHFVAGLGTTGTFTGTGRRLKSLNEHIRVIGLQPDNPMHGLEGWKHLETAEIPAIYDAAIADEFREIDTLEAYDMMGEIARKEGMLVSPSAAANLIGAIAVAESIESGVVVTTFADNADKYSEVLDMLGISNTLSK